MTVTDSPFANPCPVPPSIAEVEAIRQAEVRATRDVVMLANGGSLTVAPDEPEDWRNILLVCTLLTWLVAGIVTFKEPTYPVGAPPIVPAAEATGTLAEQVAELREEIATMQAQVDRIEGNVERKIDAYAMVEANRIVEEQGQ